MKKKISSFSSYEKSVNERFNDLMIQYQTSYNNARDDYKSSIHYVYGNLLNERYKEIQNSLGIQSRFLIEIDLELRADKNKKLEIEFQKRLSDVNTTERDLVITSLAELTALDSMFVFLKEESIKFDSEKEGSPTSLQWKSNTELEFVQMVYALYEAGYLNNIRGEITALVKELAVVFNFHLGEHWQSNLSDNINNRNTDYQPKIFDKLIKGFNDYRERQIENNKKKKPK